jgi:hypothetical protein
VEQGEAAVPGRAAAERQRPQLAAAGGQQPDAHVVDSPLQQPRPHAFEQVLHLVVRRDRTCSG